ncbi:hypothetical protein [Actinomadura fibrosa]|uniref:Secreted protein n=1 Tax=Actinomadura fibrosa TaxID=111802 RepID=A0ABW2Y374_9ACTN|nr:hypothetical protein [Actinomadura fibrosa]
MRRRAMAGGLMAAAALVSAGTLPATPAQAAGCGVRSDGRLYCGNEGDVDIMQSATYTSRYVDTLETVYSWFDCWTTGDPHSGGNRTWYHTKGDVFGRWGYVPAAVVYTSSAFDADPTAHGLRHC